MLILDVVNDCLGTLGEAPLDDMTDAHPYKSACVSILGTVNRTLQGRGWWFNREVATLTPSVPDGFLLLPASTINVRASSTVVQRHNKLYDRANNTSVFTAPLEVELVYLLDFEEAPELFASYAAAETVWRFQKRYDGDSTKTRQLGEERDTAKAEANAEETRQVAANLIEGNARLSYIKSRVRDIRGRRF